MIKKLSILCMLILFCVSVAWGDSASNRKDQTVRLGIKTGLHLMYFITTPFVVEMPGEDWTFGLVYGSGKLEQTTTVSAAPTRKSRRNTQRKDYKAMHSGENIILNLNANIKCYCKRRKKKRISKSYT